MPGLTVVHRQLSTGFYGTDSNTMTSSRRTKTPPDSAEPTQTAADVRQETPLESLSGMCAVLVVGLFVLTFIAQNFVIPSGSMENTLLVGDHIMADRITLAPPTRWMPLVRYREPRRGLR